MDMMVRLITSSFWCRGCAPYKSKIERGNYMDDVFWRIQLHIVQLTVLCSKQDTLWKNCFKTRVSL